MMRLPVRWQYLILGIAGSITLLTLITVGTTTSVSRLTGVSDFLQVHQLSTGESTGSESRTKTSGARTTNQPQQAREEFGDPMPSLESSAVQAEGLTMTTQPVPPTTTDEPHRELSAGGRRVDVDVSSITADARGGPTTSASDVLPPQTREQTRAPLLIFKDRRKPLEAINVGVKEQDRQCSPRIVAQNCSCKNSFVGSLCGGDSSGRKRCSFERCMDVFQPIPTGFPRSYSARQLRRPQGQDFVEWHRFQQHMDSISLNKSEASLSSSSSNYRTRTDGAEVHVYCNTMPHMGVTNQEIALSYCLLTAYKLNASQVYLMTLNRMQDTEVPELFDLPFLQASARRYGMEVFATTIHGPVESTVMDKNPRKTNGKKISERADSHRGGVEGKSATSTHSIPATTFRRLPENCVPKHKRASDWDGKYGRSNYPTCCGLGQWAAEQVLLRGRGETLDTTSSNITASSQQKQGQDEQQIPPKRQGDGYAAQEYRFWSDLGAGLVGAESLIESVASLAEYGGPHPAASHGGENEQHRKDQNIMSTTTSEGGREGEKKKSVEVWNCSKNTPIFVQLYAFDYGSYNAFRIPGSLPTADFFRPSVDLKLVIDDAIQQLLAGGKTSEERALVGGGNREKRKRDSVSILPVPAGSAATTSSSSSEDRLSAFRRFESKIEQFLSTESKEEGNPRCSYMGVHLRYESDAITAWPGAAQEADRDRYRILDRVDELAESLGCEKVLLTNKPLSRHRIVDRRFLDGAYAKYYVSGPGLIADLDGDDKIPGLIHGKKSKTALVQQLIDRELMRRASVAVIWDPFTGVSSFSQRIYDQRCSKKKKKKKPEEERETTSSRQKLTFSYTLPFEGDLTPEC